MSGALAKAAASIAAIGTIGGGYAWIDLEHDNMNAAHAPIAEVQQMQVGQHVQAIQGWIQAARQSGPSPWICDAINGELAQLCTKAPGHYLCTAEGRRETLNRAGCR